MPNNNPHGHNQYTKGENHSSKSKVADTDATGPGPTTTTTTTNTDNAPSGPSTPSGTSKRGFASMDEQTQRAIASKGGHSQGRENNPGNFANDREKAREAGRKGGEAHVTHR